MFGNPATDVIVALIIVLLVFAPKRLPGLGRSLGTGIREFKESITGENRGHEEKSQLHVAPPHAASRPPAPTAPSAGAAVSRPSAADPTPHPVSTEAAPESPAVGVHHAS